MLIVLLEKGRVVQHLFYFEINSVRISSELYPLKGNGSDGIGVHT